MMEMIGRKFAKRMFLEMCSSVGREEKSSKIEELMQKLTDLQKLDPEKEKPNKEQMAKHRGADVQSRGLGEGSLRERRI